MINKVKKTFATPLTWGRSLTSKRPSKDLDKVFLVYGMGTWFIGQLVAFFMHPLEEYLANFVVVTVIVIAANIFLYAALRRWALRALSRAGAKEAENRRLQKAYEQLFVDSFEMAPCPMIAISEDGYVFHLNTACLELLALSSSDIENWADFAWQDVLTERAHVPKELIERLEKILSSSAPRMLGKEFEFMFPAGTKLMRVSASTLSFAQKRSLILAIEDVQSTNTLVTNMREMVTDVALNQLKTVQKLSLRLNEIHGEDTEIRSLHADCDVFFDQINVLFDIALAQGDSLTKTTHLEFNLVTFFNTILDKFPETSELRLAKDVPMYLLGDPTQLRQCVKAVADAFFDVNQGRALRISLGVTHKSKDVLVKFESANGQPVVRKLEVKALLSKLLRFFHFQVHTENEPAPQVFLSFTFPLLKAVNGGQTIRIDRDQRLKNKKVLILTTTREVPADVQNVFDALETQKKAISYYEECAFDEIDLDAWDVIAVYAHKSHWHRDARLAIITQWTRSKSIPLLLIPGTSRRGDSIAALENGFFGYLTPALSTEELEGMLMLVSDPRAYEYVKIKGLVTRYSMREIFHSNERVLLADFGERAVYAADVLEQSLQRFGFKVVRVSSPNSFFEELFKRDYDFVFFPDDIGSSGVRRRLTLAIKRRKAICYLVNAQRKVFAGVLPVGEQNIIHNTADIAEVMRVVDVVGLQPVDQLESNERKKLTKGVA